MISSRPVSVVSMSGRCQPQLLSTAIVFLAVFVACLFGIWTRPVGFLATVWPANAVMLGLLVRSPTSTTNWLWLGGAVAFILADLMTGSPLVKALILNGANLAGIAAAYLVYTRSPAGRTGLRQPASMLYLLLSAAAGGAVAGVIGGVANPVLFGGTVLNGWTFWFATEFVNYVAILPLMLSAPAWSDIRQRVWAAPWLRKADILPAIALIVSFASAAIIGGPGALAFPVPALLWCGIAYPVFPTAVLTLLFGVWALVVISAGYVPAEIHDEMALVSLRLGISLIAVAPIILACVMQSRNDLLKRLQHLAMHDPLTGVLNRKSFREDADILLSDANRSCALLMFDLDHFKDVNDTFGHAAGDKVLIAFAERTKGCLRGQDLLGRLGGEEFAAMIFDCSQAQAITLADRIRLAAREPITLDDGRILRVSVSVGAAVTENRPTDFSIDAVLQQADAMLYRAKAVGRDRTELSMMVSVSTPTTASSSGAFRPTALQA